MSETEDVARRGQEAGSTERNVGGRVAGVRGNPDRPARDNGPEPPEDEDESTERNVGG
jgi:hypothetical protein